MKLLYLKGSKTTQREIRKLERLFFEQGINLESLYYSYSKISLLKKSKLEKALSNAISYLYPDDDEFNLVCQGTGCNLGIILANIDERINKLVLVSPSFATPYGDEKENKIKEAKEHKYFGELIDDNTLTTIEELKSLILYAKTSKMAESIIENLENKLLILYSKCDLQVSSEYINNLAQRDTIEAYGINSCSHNPLIKKPDISIPKIKQFIKK